MVEMNLGAPVAEFGLAHLKAFKNTGPGSYTAYVDQWQYGLQLPENHGQLVPVKRPTCFRTIGCNIKGAVENLNIHKTTTMLPWKAKIKATFLVVEVHVQKLLRAFHRL